MFSSLVQKFFGTHHDREMRKIRPLIERINSLESSIQSLEDAALKAKTSEFKERIERGESLDRLLPETFAVCREVSKRVLNMRHYDVQLVGGVALYGGSVAEMKTGEGKTLVATLPLYLYGLTGRGAHLVTVNDYLAQRDCEWMGQVYDYLGLTRGTIVANKSDLERKQAYGSDITYGTNNEFGFDYLRDNMKFSLEDYVQRELHFAIVDECDSILVDEARTPLIISGPSEESVDKYYEINKVIPKLKEDIDFKIDEKSKSATLTEEGNKSVEKLLGLNNLYDIQNIDLLHHVYQGLKAHSLFKRDTDYVVKNDSIIIVDEFTGRLMEGRRWSDGLHQAIEAKEGVEVKKENQTLASITFQNFFKMYKRFSGMTGTAETEAVEFKKIYNLSVQVIPTNKPICRKDLNDMIYKTEQGKYRAIAKDVVERNKQGQPILVGTTSIEKSERLSNLLNKKGVNHNVLNAKFHEKEALLVAQAGRLSQVTIATNMAGRGTDIVLGGNPESLSRLESDPEVDMEAYQRMLEKYSSICADEKKKVLEAGGLYIIGTERHESRRIDNQLRGRSGRQGDVGGSRFYLSLEDDLMRIFNGERIQKIMTTLNLPEDEPIEAKMISRAIEGAQKKVEGHHFDIRKHLLDYDNVMNQQRTTIYNMRRSVLDDKKTETQTLEMLSDLTSYFLDAFIPQGDKKKWNFSGLMEALEKQFGVKVYFNDEMTEEAVANVVQTDIKSAFEERRKIFKDDFLYLQQMIALQTIDNYWKAHLAQMDRLREGINLRAYAQKDPLIEYKKEGFAAFEALFHNIALETLEKIFKVQLVSSEEGQAYFEEQHKQQKMAQKNYHGVDDAVSGGVRKEEFGEGPHAALPREGSESEGLNRAQRRRLKKQKK